MSQVALSWLMNRRGVPSVLIGASKLSQLEDNLGALNLKLTTAEELALTETSALAAEFSDSLTSPFIRQLVYGGHSVKAWSEN